MDYLSILKEIYQAVQPLKGRGKVAAYIPALEEISGNKLGMAISTLDGEEFEVGDAREPFSIQSISKVFSLTMALQIAGNKIWKRVGREPSGSAFNSLVQLEYEAGKPRNPFINAGALVIDDILVSEFTKPRENVLKSTRMLAGSNKIQMNKKVANSEKKHSFRNQALANLMKSFGNIENNVADVLDLYIYQCALDMSCMDLARAFLFLANHGKHPVTGDKILSASEAKRVGALMLTCGLYNEAGEFAFRVGLPGKSGIGGGIVAIIPEVLSVCVWSPELDKYGNSLIGIKALELFTTMTGMSVF